MTLLIRADATTQMGTGHVMRCLALVQVWKEKGGQVVFLSHCENQALKNRIIDEGCNLIPIENPYPHPDDLKETLRILELHAPCSMPRAPRPWLALDGCHFDAGYQRKIQMSGYRLLVIDDMGALDHYYADVILNQNIKSDNLEYPCEQQTVLLLGTKYALLRKEFVSWHNGKRDIPGVARKILLTMGGSDPDNVTLKVIDAIKLLKDTGIEVQVIVGPSNPHLNILMDAMLSATCYMRCVHNVTNMPELMSWADIAVSAAGSTCWELAFMGVPSITVVLAENQKMIAEELDRSCVVCNVGDFNSLFIDGLVKELSELQYDRGRRLLMSRTAMRIVDGRGGERLLDQMAKIA